MTTGCKSWALLGAPQALGVFHLSVLALLFLNTRIVGTSLPHHRFHAHVSAGSSSPGAGELGSEEWVTSVPFFWAGSMERQGQVWPTKHSVATIIMLLLLCFMGYHHQQQRWCVLTVCHLSVAELRTGMQCDRCHLWLLLGYCCHATSKPFPHRPEASVY